ncbi:MAG: LuxR C-terminal-related transcriptional regulator [Nocardioides sp.]
MPQLEQAYAAVAAAESFHTLVTAAESAVLALGGTGVSVGVLNGSRVAIVYRGADSPALEDLDSVLANADRPAPSAMRSGEAVFLSNQEVTTLTYPATADLMSQIEFEAAACLPLQTDTEPLGFLVAHYLGEQDFDEFLRAQFATLAATCSGALNRLVNISTLDGHLPAALAKVEQAKGMLIERCGLSEPAAAVALQAMAAESKLGIREVAELLMARRRVPGLQATAAMAEAVRGVSPATSGGPLPATAPAEEESILSARESELMALITAGATNREIATRMHLSINSVKTYIRSAYRKINVTSRSQAVLWGVRNGYLSHEQDHGDPDADQSVMD